MPDLDDVRALALALPRTTETVSRGHRFWRVGGRGFVWERPLRTPDLAELGQRAPEGPILGARTASLQDKQALIASEPDVYFTTTHFDGYCAVLVVLERIDDQPLYELVVEAWLARAPLRLAREWAAANLPGDAPRD